MDQWITGSSAVECREGMGAGVWWLQRRADYLIISDSLSMQGV